jgi:hypothetical protein
MSARRSEPGLEPDNRFVGDDFCVQALRMESARVSASTSAEDVAGAGDDAGKRRTLTLERPFWLRSFFGIVFLL